MSGRTPAGRPALLDAGLGVRGAFTTRGGGGGAAPFAGLNLGDHVGDDPARVAAHRAAVRRAAGAEHLVLARQVHGAQVVVVDGPPAVVPEADAVVTTRPELALAVVVADCVPVLLADPAAGVVAVAHAGRPGMVAGVVPAVVAAMRDLGARDVRAVTGPAVCGGCYEVPAAMREEVCARVPEAWARTRSGTPAVDVVAGVTAQLLAAGVRTGRVQACTVEDGRFFSHRREGRTGRFAGVVRAAAGRLSWA
ncbi:peptidoglycan editing factor PgeF [Kineococcus glutinatus]|uniref:Purine nucleoside phosphorylase n=1 Tax=Kineococcus glutinatus TaxID=1070872 RepID=A0ABP8VIS6_9ACTN